MQIRRLHKSVYKLYAYVRTQACLDDLRRKHKERVHLWEKLRREGVREPICAELAAFSRATYYRSKTALKDLAKGKRPPSKAPRRRNKPQWGEAEKQLVLMIRRANPTL